MNTATIRPQVIVGAPGQLLPYLASMDKLAAQMRKQTQAINAAIGESTRALQFLVEQYKQSTLAKQRQAKQNLTAACNAALLFARRTLRELVANLIEQITTTPGLQLRELLSEQHQANAPNRCTVKTTASLRQQLQTKSGTHKRF